MYEDRTRNEHGSNKMRSCENVQEYGGQIEYSDRQECSDLQEYVGQKKCSGRQEYSSRQECGDLQEYVAEQNRAEIQNHAAIQNQGRNRQVDNAVWIPVLKELLENGKQVRINVSGSSMSPLICHQRDSVLLEPIKRELKRGDIVFYQRTNGQYVLHRIYKVDRKGNVYCIGDAQKDIEGPLNQNQFFAIVISVNRKGKWISPGDFWWEFFEHVWLRIIPLRRFVMWLYGKIQ